MAVLVTGGAGYIGSHAVKALLAAGRRVVVFDDFSAGHRGACAALQTVAARDQLTVVEASIADTDRVAETCRTHDVDAAMHFAAWLLGQASVFQFYNPAFMRDFGVGVLNGALWTISVELQFYMLTPILFWLIARGKAALYILIAASVAINVFLRVHHDWTDLRVKLASVSFLPWVYMYLLGMLVSSRKASVESLLDRVPLWLVVGAYVASMLAVGNYADNASNAINPLSVVLIAMLLFKMAKRDLRLPQWLTGFVRRNDLSYGIYLYHMPVINTVLYFALMPHAPLSQLAIVLVASLALAGFSWFQLERKILRLKG